MSVDNNIIARGLFQIEVSDEQMSNDYPIVCETCGSFGSLYVLRDTVREIRNLFQIQVSGAPVEVICWNQDIRVRATFWRFICVDSCKILTNRSKEESQDLLGATTRLKLIQ